MSNDTLDLDALEDHGKDEITWDEGPFRPHEFTAPCEVVLPPTPTPTEEAPP